MAELIAAAHRAKLDEVRRLLGRGVDASAADFSNGETALHAVCCANHNPMSERARVAVVRELLVVSEEKRLQVLTPKGVPLQVIKLGSGLRRMCADDQRVWVADRNANQVLALSILVY